MYSISVFFITDIYCISAMSSASLQRMRTSPLRHTLAILRTTIGLTQKEMAKLTECSAATIQAIELGKLKLSDRIISLLLPKTGISGAWLDANDITQPPLATGGKPYSKLIFEQHQAAMFSPPKTSDAAWADLFDSWCLFAQSVEILSCLQAEAFKQRNAGMVGYKIAMAMLQVAKENLKQPDGLNSLKSASENPSKLPAEPLANIQEFVKTFAKATYLEFRQRVDTENKPIERDIAPIIRYYDKTLGYTKSKRHAKPRHKSK